MTDLRMNVKQIASETGKTYGQVISDLQTAAASTGNDSLLAELCELKWEIINDGMISDTVDPNLPDVFSEEHLTVASKTLGISVETLVNICNNKEWGWGWVQERLQDYAIEQSASFIEESYR